MRCKLTTLAISASLALPCTCGLSKDSSHPPLPTSLPEDTFTSLVESSPFTRLLNLSDTLVLSGIALLGETQVLTIVDTEDGSSITVSEQANERGWHMVDIKNPDSLESATASISFEGGEIIRVRYNKERLALTHKRMGYKAQARAQIAKAKEKARNHTGDGPAHGVSQQQVSLLNRISQIKLPEGYRPGDGRNAEESHRLHQNFVQQRMAQMSAVQKGQVGQLWQQQVAVNPQMPNRGAAFVRILEHVSRSKN